MELRVEAADVRISDWAVKIQFMSPRKYSRYVKVKIGWTMYAFLCHACCPVLCHLCYPLCCVMHEFVCCVMYLPCVVSCINFCVVSSMYLCVMYVFVCCVMIEFLCCVMCVLSCMHPVLFRYLTIFICRNVINVFTGRNRIPDLH